MNIFLIVNLSGETTVYTLLFIHNLLSYILKFFLQLFKFSELLDEFGAIIRKKIFPAMLYF